MHLFIQCPDGRIMTIEVLRTETVGSLKPKICEKKGYEIDTQTLVFEDAELEDKNTFEFYNIINETTLKLSLIARGAEGIDSFVFFVIIPAQNNQRTCSIKGLSKESTGLDLKHKMNELEGFEINKQHMVFGGKPIRDEVSLRDTGLYDGCSVFLSFKLPGGITL